MKPAFWADSRLAELPEPTRLFYIGLWMIADDAGWLRWDPIEVARDLYGYDGRAKRERRSTAMFDELLRAGRVILHPCGHAEVPKLANHQHLSVVAKQVRTVNNEHLRECGPASPAQTRGNPPSPVDPRPVNGTDVDMDGNGTDRVGKGTARADAPRAVHEPTEFQQRVPREEALGRSA